MVYQEDNELRPFTNVHQDPEISSPVTGEKKLRLVLKTTKHDDEEGMEENQQIGFEEKNGVMNTNADTRACKICGKELKSGKALGGHMRIHDKKHSSKRKLKVDRFAESKEKQCGYEDGEGLMYGFVVKKSQFKRTNRGLEGHDDDETMTCVVCGKEFHSMKSLSGHLRCHPERGWRGIQPPTMERNSSSSTLSDADPEMDDDQIEEGDDQIYSITAKNDRNQVADLTELLPQWSRTGKRGQNSVTAAAMEDEEICNAANLLLMLTNGGFSSATISDALPYEAEICGVNGISGVENDEAKGGEEEFQVEGSTMYIEKGKGVAECEPICVELDKNSEGDIQLGDDVFKKLSGQDEQESQCKENANESLTIKFKKKRRKVKLSELESAQNARLKYRCDVCGKSYATHQALGGHMSSHNKYKPVSQNSLVESENLLNPTDENVEGSMGILACTRGLDIDLNEMAPPDDEAGKSRDGNEGYASSSPYVSFLQ